MSVFKPNMAGEFQSKNNSFKPSVTVAATPKVNNNQGNITDKKRKTRSDKKTDIKVPVTIQQKQKLMILAKLESAKKGQRISVTRIGSILVQKALLKYEDFPNIEYDPSLKTVHVKLEQFYVDELFNHQMEWDVSMREAATRILSHMLEESNGEVQ